MDRGDDPRGVLRIFRERDRRSSTTGAGELGAERARALHLVHQRVELGAGDAERDQDSVGRIEADAEVREVSALDRECAS